ncbi:hypothetical protein J422_05419 [Methanocaldococcus villosus KIN24-T80]|uniref:Uncharacterized protein n=1 Tax=Methanocaldococcus villosus KIN24-T80 TaxID=1069083 RepID=N6VXL8_9EURY|nr:hypothetical protein [Methanocaldococcus villosus]ENN95882.1 hypothetical protein J422_05419 [Methanocaldococcus villosus KIN24-T80]
MRVGITKMYKDIADLIGLEEYEIVDPYNKNVNCDFLIISKGYKERVKMFNKNAYIFEVRSATFKDLIESLNELKKLGLGKRDKIDESIEMLKKKERDIKSLINFKFKVNPKTEFIKRVVEDLGLEISEDGVTIAPDYVGEADIIIETHKNLPLIERIEDRYLQIINKIKRLSHN